MIKHTPNFVVIEDSIKDDTVARQFSDRLKHFLGVYIPKNLEFDSILEERCDPE